MAAKAPPIPPAQRATRGEMARIRGAAGVRGADRGTGRRDQGPRRNSQQTTHHSHQQDR